MNESIKLSVEVRKACGHKESLVSVRDHKHNTLNLALSSRNRVDEMRINLGDIPITDMIHLRKNIGYIIDIDSLNSTIKISKMHTSKSRVENQLRQEKV